MYKAIDKWLLDYLRSVFRRPGKIGPPVHLFVALCDHYEPLGPADGLGIEYGRDCVARWQREYPKLFGEYRDADGRPPQHTFFYPEDQYVEELVEGVCNLCENGFGEVEIHLHHRNDTAATLRDKLVAFRDLLHQQHGLLGTEATSLKRGARSAACPATCGEVGLPRLMRGGLEPPACRGEAGRRLVSGADAENPEPGTQNPSTKPHGPSAIPRYAFIHGNWAICNSRPDGDWCGVDNEVRVLLETGCYADMTMPSAPSPTQARKVNSIYYVPATAGVRGHDKGRRACVKQQPDPAEELLFVQGPLALNFSSRKFGMLPRIENADLAGGNLPDKARLDLWLQQHIHVVGKPEWMFIKLHTHGCLPRNADAILSSQMQNFHSLLKEYSQDERFILHYVTAREMVNIIKATEQGASAWREDLRNCHIKVPPRFQAS